ncbi:FadR/GntR family transcriptional regulator [Ruania alba]|nr:FCD domain-containing protein [Ruania alba]
MNGQSSTVRPRRLPQWLADQIEAEVVRAAAPAGTKLPTEVALAKDYDVSRQVVREAARLLEDRGLVSISPGRGMTVAALGMDVLVDRYQSVLRRDRAGFSELMHMRQMLEPEMTAEAARRRTGADVNAIEQAVDAASDATRDFASCLDADMEFHRLVAVATRNRFVVAFVEPINRVLRETYTDPTGYLATQPATIEEHRAIARAIRAQDPAAAAQAASTHLARVTCDAPVLVDADPTDRDERS